MDGRKGKNGAQMKRAVYFLEDSQRIN